MYSCIELLSQILAQTMLTTNGNASGYKTAFSIQKKQGT